jgi:hypothetical protein
MCIKDVVLPRLASSYELRDITACSPYTITLRALGSNATHSGLVRKDISSIVAGENAAF